MKAKKTRNAATLIRLRYAYPVLWRLLLTVWLFLPCMRFTVSGERPRAALSLMTLLGNAFANCRVYLFSASAEKDAAADAFAPIVFALVLALLLLYLISLAVSVWALLCALQCAKTKKPDRMRKLFMTLIPHRAVLLILQALCLPLTLFPLMLVGLYERYLLLWVNLSHTFLPPLLIGVLFYAGEIALTLLCAKRERATAIDPFSTDALRPPVSHTHAPADQAPEAESSTLYRMKQDSAAEQAERLRRLLGKDEEDR